MYKNILVTLDTTPSDRAIINHVKRLAKLMEARLFFCTWPTDGRLDLWVGCRQPGSNERQGIPGEGP